MSSGGWIPVHNHVINQWLLANGQIVSTPALEQTPAGRRIRIAGTKQAVNRGYESSIVRQAVKNVAEAQRTKVWCSIANKNNSNLGSRATVDSGASLALKFIDGENPATTAWWSFKHPDYPIEAVLKVVATTRYGKNVQISTTFVSSRLNPEWIDENGVINYNGNRWNGVAQDSDTQTRVNELMRDDPPAWVAGIREFFGQYDFATPRQAVHELLKRVQKFEDLASVQIPNALDNENPSWMVLPLYETNVTGEFIQTLIDFLDTASSMTDVKIAYDEFRKAMARAGFTLPQRSEDDLAGALGTETESVYVEMGHSYDPHENSPSEDATHTVYLHLTTGSLLVACTRHDLREEAGEKWDQAVTVASLTGRQGDLLAFANEYARNKADSKVREFVNARRMSLK